MMKLTKDDYEQLRNKIRANLTNIERLEAQIQAAEIIEEEPEVRVPPDQAPVIVNTGAAKLLRVSAGYLEDGFLACYNEGAYQGSVTFYSVWQPLEAQWIDNTGANPAPGRRLYIEFADGGTTANSTSDNIRWTREGLCDDVKRCIILPED